jgi:HK97 family phage major capsid protein
MSDKLKELRAKRGKLVHDMRAITEAGTAEKRDLSNEELAQHSALFDEVENLREQITAEERSIEAGRLIADRQDERNENRAAPKSEAELRMAGFRSYLSHGRIDGEGAEEYRAFQAGSDTEGGYLIAPEQFVQQMIQAVDNAVFIRGLATKFQVGQASSLGAPTLDTDAEDTDWTTELLTGNEEDSIRFGKRNLHPHPMAKRVKISNDLIRKAVMPVEQIIIDRMSYKVGVTQEKAFLTGNGAQQPLGVFTASANGISTGRDVSTGNSTTAITFDGLIEAKYSLKAAYWGSAQWLFHRDAVKMITKLKDGDGQYLWRESVRVGEPDTVLGMPMNISEYAPNTFTTGLYVGLLGDFSKYWIADALTMQMQRLTELYAETNQIGFISRVETDGMPVLEEAFARVKLA